VQQQRTEYGSNSCMPARHAGPSQDAKVDLKPLIISIIPIYSLSETINLLFFLFLIFLTCYKPIGAAPRGMFLWGGRVSLGNKVCNAPRATDFREERNPPQADNIVSNNKLCTIQYCNITIPYCNIVPYYVKNIAIYHIAASAGMPHPSRPRRHCYRSAADVSPPSSHRTGPSFAAIS
jgi:hypothetical protein